MASRKSPRSARPKPPVSLSDVARAAGVTATAVSALFKGRFYGGTEEAGRGATVGISSEAREKILHTAKRIGYEPVDPAWWLRLYPERGDTCFLLPSVVTDGLANPYFSRFVSGAMARLHVMGRHLAFAYYEHDIDYIREPERLPAPLKFHQASNFLVAGNPNPTLLRALAERNLPTVYLSRIVDFPGVSSMAPDYAAAVRMQFKYLSDLGHRRIVVGVASYLTSVSYAWSILEPSIAAAWEEFFPQAKACNCSR